MEKKHEFEPVHIRAKEIKGGKKSLYLDIVSNGVRRKEYLKLYLVPETDQWAKAGELAFPLEAEIGACSPDIGCSACIESGLVAYLQFVDLAETDFLFSSIFLA